MITFSSNISELLSKNTVELFYLIRISEYFKVLNTISDLRATTFYEDITLSNGEVYKSDGTIISIAPPKFESTVDKSSFELILADPGITSMTNLEKNLIGNDLEISVGFVNIETDTPLLNKADTLLIYKGYIDNFSYKIITKELGEVLLSITGSSPMVNLDQKRQYHLNKEFVRSKFPSDSCCDQINEGSGVIVLKWGKV